MISGHVHFAKKQTQMTSANKNTLLIYIYKYLWLDKGDFPENVHTVCPCQNKEVFI